MWRGRSWLLPWLAACALLASGCGQKLYRAETTLEADGRASRAIYQPADDTPAEARRADVWTQVTYAAEIRPNQWSGGIRELPVAAADKEHPYLAAWGEFATPAKLPQHYVKPAPRGLPDGKLAIDYRREDYVFVVEHRWKETLTDVVTLDGMHKGRQQFLELVIPLARKCLEAGLGPAYDVDGVSDWLRDTGSPWFIDASDVFFEAGVRGELSPNEKWKSSLADVCERYGLQLRDERGQLLDQDRARATVAAYAAKMLRDHLRRRDGAPVPDEAINDLLEWLNLADRSNDKNPRLARLDGLAKQVITEKYGNTQAFEELITPLGVRMLGLYRVEILGPPRRFHYTLNTPGPIVETNGLLVSNRQVRWTFEAVQAYPFGYPMECRSLVALSEVQKKLLGNQPLATREEMLNFVALVDGDFALRETLRSCVKRGTLDPLYRLRDKLAAEAGDNAQSFDKAIKLLKLPPRTEN